MTTTERLVLEWLANGKTGVSSETMAFWLAFGVRTEHGSTPSDPDDLNRCLQLLDTAPQLRMVLHEMAAVSPDWARLVKEWPVVEETFLDEVGLGWTKAHSAPRTYALMKKVLGE